jgi:hypothetical protein
MKKYLLIFIIFLFSSCSFIKTQEQNKVLEPSIDGFVSGSEDIPLLKNLVQISEDNLGFDSSAGSISSVTYTNVTDVKEVKEFYVRTLPQMGWKSIKKDLEQIIFIRNNEKLEISFVEENGENLVKFFITSTL